VRRRVVVRKVHSARDVLKLARLSEDALLALNQIRDALVELESKKKAKRIALSAITVLNRRLDRWAVECARRYLDERGLS